MSFFTRGDNAIPARLLNDAAALSRAKQLGLLEKSPARNKTSFGGNNEDGKLIWLKVTSADYNRYDVLPIKGPRGATPTATGSAQFQGMTGNPVDSEEFRRLACWEEGTSTYNGAGTGIGSVWTWFAVLLDKIKQNDIGPAKITGLFAREITVNYAHHRYARMKTKSPNAMESALTGPFRIWSRHNNLGGTYPRSEWCILEVNRSSAGETFKGKSNAAIALDATTGSVSVWDKYTGTFADTGEDITLTNSFGAISASGKDVKFDVPFNCDFYDLINGEC